jgi:hypothetical protein
LATIIGGNMGYTYWDVHFKRTKKNMLNFINALIDVHGRLCDSDDFSYGYTKELIATGYRGCYILIRISIPDGQKFNFETRSGLKLQEPPKVQVS